MGYTIARKNNRSGSNPFRIQSKNQRRRLRDHASLASAGDQEDFWEAIASIWPPVYPSAREASKRARRYLSVASSEDKQGLKHTTGIKLLPW